MMNWRNPLNRRLACFLTTAAMGLTGGLMTQAQDETDDTVFELNPFEVSAGTGYIAQRTLAGTRLNSELVNVPQQISVFTEDFLEDIAATNPQDAMLYSLNVENLSEFTDAGDANANRGIGFNDFGGRVRGIADSGRMRDFFDTNLQGDTYNLSQITVSSGPNAVIYGLAGTGGVINASFKKAQINQTFYTIGTRFDTEDSARLTLDLNQEVYEDKLSVRFIGLWDDFNTYRNSTPGTQDRYFLTLTAQPWKGATLRAYYEDVDIDKVLPRNIVAYDGGVTAYLEHVANGGDPYYDNSLGTSIQPEWVGLVEKYNQNRDHWILQGTGTPINIGPASGGTLNTVRTIAPDDLAPNPSDRFPWSLSEDSPLVSLEHNLHGETTGRHMYGEIYGVIFNQQLTQDLAIEFGYNHEFGYTDFWNMAMPSAALVRVDPNLYLPDGVTPNPWKGQMYVEHWGQSTTDFNEMWGGRITVSYNLDLREVSKWLGRHQFMGLYTEDRYDRFWSWVRTRTIPADQVDSYVYNAGSGAGQGQTWYRWYIDPETYEMVNPFDPLNGGPQPDGTFVYARGNSPASGFTWSSLAKRTGATAAVQSFWLDDRLVTTLGYRKGWFRNGAATVGFAQNSNPDVQWGRENIRDVDRSLDSWGDETSEDAINYGGVLHITKSDNKLGQWSVFYNFADIFNSPTPGHFPDDSGIPAAIGESYDYGIIWQGFDAKIGFRLNFYKTQSANNNNCNWCTDIRNRVVNIEKRISAPGAITDDESSYAYILTQEPERFLDANGNQASAPTGFDPGTFSLDSPLSYWHMVANRESKGVELEAFANPTPNLTIRLTAAKNEATDVDGLRGWNTWIQERYDYWKTWADWEQTTYRDGTETPIGDEGGSITEQFNILAPAYTTLANADGVRVSQNAGWRVNFTARYNFKDGFLKGGNVGGHIRYRQSPVIGYVTLPADSPFANWPKSPAQFTAPSLDDPVNAPSLYDFDLFAGYNMKLGERVKCSIRLNIRNVLDDTDMVPQRALSDGTIAVYTYKPPRTFILSVDFTY